MHANQSINQSIHLFLIDNHPAVGTGGSKENNELKQTVGAIFVALLAAEFILTPFLKPILLAANDSS